MQTILYNFQATGTDDLRKFFLEEGGDGVTRAKIISMKRAVHSSLYMLCGKFDNITCKQFHIAKPKASLDPCMILNYVKPTL